MIVEAIEGQLYWINFYEILPRLREIQAAKAAGRQVRLRIDVNTEWVNTNFGPA